MRLAEVTATATSTTATTSTFMSMLTLRPLVSGDPLVRIRWLVIPDRATAFLHRPPSACAWLGGVLHRRDHSPHALLLAAGNNDGDAVTHYRPLGREARYRQQRPEHEPPHYQDRPDQHRHRQHPKHSMPLLVPV